MSAFAIGLLLGVTYGLFVVPAFLYAILLGVAVYDNEHNLPNIAQQGFLEDLVPWFLGEIGAGRIVLYILIALFWPIVVVFMLATLISTRVFGIGHWVRWTVLGFGKLTK